MGIKGLKKEKREKQIMIVRFVHNNNDPLYNYVKKRKSVFRGKRKPQYNKTFSYFLPVVKVLLIETESI